MRLGKDTENSGLLFKLKYKALKNNVTRGVKKAEVNFEILLARILKRQ